jgi:CRP/FNR family transcriptional regulator, anaerobic regulatory protein
MLLYYISPGETCIMSFLGAVCNERSKIRAVVVEPAEITLLPLDKAMTWIRTRPDWLDFIFSLYNKRFEELLAVVNAIAFQKMDERLWDLLQKKAQTLRTREFALTHQQLAEDLGTAREVVSRLLKQLERQEKIQLSRNKITLL